MLGSRELAKLAEYALTAAKQASEYIQSATSDPIAVQQKSGGDTLASQVFTEVDLKSQEIILAILSETFAPFDIALLTEESEDSRERLVKEYFWCVDPLDGTLPFIESTPGYSVSIALVQKDGTPVIGVIADPVTGTVYHALKGKGAFRNGVPYAIRREKQSSLTHVADRSFLKLPNYKDIFTALSEIAQKTGNSSVKSISFGGAAMNACWVIEHAPAVYFKFPKKSNGGGSLWDYAASAVICSESGGWVSDIHGAPLDLNRSDSTFMNHRGILYASNEHIANDIMNLYRVTNQD